MSNFNQEPLHVPNHNGKHVDCTQIHDLWHLAMRLAAADREKVLHTWRQAHALQDALLSLRVEFIADHHYNEPE